ncbi:DUF1501 domain-containing protein [Patulibacter brassicae]|uniref:DUF1501 domain-containing protein n=1 Tax=Patulibacter brassicae TaxID=1705717 RepID=A0ABU4VH77_9ACTN|nr:DUF1501 domain-containing protein [Patulibacter brassicae]MDX8151161.1 DUF1501 domain-containing protein [Patulibacter brassicae]
MRDIACCRPVEPGRPVPAGRGLTRRSVLLSGIGLGLTLFGGRALSPQGVAEAVAAASPADRVLVCVSLSGGVDGLSLAPPQHDRRYDRRLRPQLWVDPATTLAMRGTDELRWHPAAASLKRLHDRGRLTLLPAVGYDGPNHSHFTSRHFYEVGATDPQGTTGWLGRYLDVVGTDHNPLQGLTLGETISPMLAASRVSVAATDRPQDYRIATPGIDGGPFHDELLRAFAALGRGTSPDPVLDAARAVHGDAVDLHGQLQARFADGPETYPEGRLGTRLADMARLLGAGLPIRCGTIDAALDFDSHANQDGSFGRQVDEVGRALEAFQSDLERRGIADRVLTLVWSEFGRRPEENGSVGTDHGAGGVAMLLGTRVRGGQLGAFPGLASLDPDGNLRATVDYRGLYCSLLEEWLEADAGPIVPGADRLERYALLA